MYLHCPAVQLARLNMAVREDIRKNIEACIKETQKKPEGQATRRESAELTMRFQSAHNNKYGSQRPGGVADVSYESL
jgi:hypothetical protein